ncbi:MAG: hypothetical protein H0X30_23860 [Anaerolineae bacterium]|nr:hypothetical protein [Anaerolineae bacterium]
MNISEHVTISIELTPDERDKFERLARKQGYTVLTDYLHHIMMQDLALENDNQEELSPEATFREGWADIVAGRVYPASSLWDETDDD